MKEYFETLGLTNQFQASQIKNLKLNFWNETEERTNVTSIEINQGGIRTVFPAKPEDNVAMALSILGVGRVTDEIEERAHEAASLGGGRSVEDLIEYAVINLRAALITRQQEQEAASKDLDDAYALYKLAYPKALKTLEEFKGVSVSHHWLANLRKVRQDPTVLGAL
jgi:hypothetical protein